MRAADALVAPREVVRSYLVISGVSRSAGLGRPIDRGAVTVLRGDLIVGDNDDVVALPKSEAYATVDRGRKRADRESRVMADCGKERRLSISTTFAED